MDAAIGAGDGGPVRDQALNHAANPCGGGCLVIQPIRATHENTDSHLAVPRGKRRPPDAPRLRLMARHFV
jgi:hypothetical protein